MAEHREIDEPRSISRVVVFDIDGTLYDTNTLYGCLGYVHEANASAWTAYFRFMRTLAARLVSTLMTRLTGRELIRDITISSLRGINTVQFETLCREYVASVLPRFEIAPVHEMLEKFLRSGAHVVLVSGTIEPIAEAIKSSTGATTALAGRPDASGGTFSGRLATDVRGRKVAALKALGLLPDDLTVVTDNRDDLALLRVAQEAVVVTRPKDLAWWRAQGLTNVQYVMR